MNRMKVVGLAAYLLLAVAISSYYLDTGEIFIGVAAPFLSGVVLALGTGLRVEFQDVSWADVRGELWISGILIVAPALWYLTYGCVFGCPA